MRRLLLVACAVVCAFVAGSGPGSSATQTHWQAVKLGMLSIHGFFDLESSAAAVDSRGDVVGSIGPPQPESMLGPKSCADQLPRLAVLWRAGRPIDLGTLGGPQSSATAINDRGTVIGWSETRSCAMHGFVWQQGKMVDLGTLGGPETAPVAIDDRDQVVGWSSLRGSTASSPRQHASLWQNGRMTDLGTLGGATSGAGAIDDRGDVVGWSDLKAARHHHAFLWRNGKMTDLGTLGGFTSTAIAVDDHGWVVGSSTTPKGTPHRFTGEPFLWRGGKMTPLAPASAEVAAIDDSGRIYGNSHVYGEAPNHVLLWHGGNARDLGLGYLAGIDERGDAVGSRTDPAGAGEALLWRNGATVDLGPGSAAAIDTTGTYITGNRGGPGSTRAVLWTRR